MNVLSKIAILFFFFTVAFAMVPVQAATIICGPQNIQNAAGHWVRVPGSGGCKSRDGTGTYNGRRTTGLILGAVLGGGIAHALGGSPGEIVGGLASGAQTGTYVGSTYDQDRRERDLHVSNAKLCASGGLGYNTNSGTCVAVGGQATTAQVGGSSQEDRQAQGEAICRERHGEAVGFDITSNQCTEPAASQDVEQAPLEEEDSAAQRREDVCAAKVPPSGWTKNGLNWGPRLYEGKWYCDYR